MTDWAIPQQAKLKYTQLFNLHDRSRSGFLSGLQCRDILMQSGLPRNVLAEIWNLSDIDGDGQLTREEFILAMHLTNQVRAGQTLPQELPPDLVPPSYRRTRSISTTSVHSATSSVCSVGLVPPSAVASLATSSSINDDQLSQKSIETTTSASTTAAGSILNANTFEDKRRENFEKGRAELERRRLKIIEQQTNIISEQLVKCKKQVADAKSKIDSMRSERDAKAGLITSLEAQLKTIRDRKAFLDHEEVQIIAIARDLNLVNSPHSADLDQQATVAKQESINQMKEKLLMLNKERDSAVKQLAEAQAKLEESKKELKTLSAEATESFENYNEKIANAKVLKQQFIEESKSKPIDFGSVWDASPGAPASQADPFSKATDPIQDPFPSSATSEDPWASTTTTTIATTTATDPFAITKQPFDEPFASKNNQSTTPINDSSNNNNNNNNDNIFDSTRDYSPFASSASPKMSEKPESNSFNEMAASEPTRRKMYQVLFEFEARNPDELTINPGDIITGSEVFCEPGWLSGELNGKSGLFPEAYVEPLLDDERPASVASVSDPFGPTSTSQAKSEVAAPIQSQQQPEKANTSSSTIVKYKVIYVFEARNPDELTINPGDIITGVDAPHEPGWLMGELAGQRGLFPEAYVERLAEVQFDQASEHTGTLRRGSSSGSLRSKKSRAKKAEVATVIANYRALGQEQLNLEKGQLVLIRRKIDSGWWEGELQIKDQRSSTEGYDKQLPEINGNELDHLIGELVDSELDYVNDLRLCQNAYIQPLSVSFDVSQIFTNWSKLIEMHEATLKRLHGQSTNTHNDHSVSSPRYFRIFEAFQKLMNSIVELYVDFCSRQNDAARHLEAKIASDIRFKQLVCDSQRRLRKLIEINDVQNDDHTNIERALRNTNLPLTTFLLKPMQRITKYGLIFDRMLKEVEKHQDKLAELRNHLQLLRDSAQALCKQVNEACRMREDDQDNLKRLRWCQSHILQQANGQTDGLTRSAYSSIGQSVSPLSVDLRLSAELICSQPFTSHHESASPHSSSSLQQPPPEHINFNSNTNCLGPRRLIKAGTLVKFRSGRELLVFLFTDFILLTQIKGGASLRVENVFRSDRAQQAYYKFYRAPIMLEDIQTNNFDNELQQQQQQQMHGLSCPTLGTPPMSINKEQEALVVSFLDRHANCIYNLIAMSAKEKADWDRVLSERVLKAKEACLMHQFKNSLKASRRLSISDCFGRLFVTVLELVRISSAQSSSASSMVGTIDNSWKRRTSRNHHQEPQVQNLCIRLQLKLYKRTRMILDDDQKREIIPTSDEFKTKAIIFSSATRQPAMVDMNESMSNLELLRDVLRFDESGSTQFLLASGSLDNPEGAEYLEMELLDDSRLRETRQLGRKRIGLEQLLGRTNKSDAATSLIGDPSETWTPSSRTLSIRSGRGIQPLQPNRPVEMTFKLKSIAPDFSEQSNGSNQVGKVTPADQLQKIKYNVKLRLHLQMFCDINKLI